jgi:membrane protein YqaA with SNARE-associated domain
VFYLFSLLVFIPSPLLQFINAEAWAIFVGLTGQRSPVLLGVVLGVSQTLGFAGLYLFGHKLLARWGRLNRVFARFDVERMRHRAPYLLALGSTVGLPPHNALALAAPLVSVPLRVVLVFTLPGRVLRFIVIGLSAQWIVSTFSINTDWIPEWLRALV